MADQRNETAPPLRRASIRPSEPLNPVAEELAREYPLLWDKATQFDFAQKLGGCTDPLLAEIDQAMHELWMARQEKRDA